MEEEYERLAKEWEMWGIKSYLETTNIWSKKYDVIDEADVSMIRKFSRERDRMREAKKYLAEKGKFKDKNAEDVLEGKITDRWLSLDDYRLDKFGGMKDRLHQAKEEEKQRVREKAEEMEEKYKQ